MLGGAIGASAETLHVQTRINLDQAARRTGLTTLERPLLLNRGQSVAVAGGMRRGELTTHLLRLADSRQFLLRTPISAYLQYGERRAGARLLFYDSVHRQAGLLLTARGAGRSSYLYAPWKVNSAPAGPPIEISQSERGRAAEILPIGYWPRVHRFFAAEVAVKTRAANGRRVTVMSFDRYGEPRVVKRLSTERPVHALHFDRRNGRALVAEYVLGKGRRARALGHLIDLRTGQARSLELPKTAYGIAFAPDGKSVHAYSSSGGTLVSIDTRTGGRGTVRRVGGLGHALGSVGESSVVVVRNAAVQLHDAHSGVRRASLSTSRLFDGVAHTEGSLVAGRSVVVKNGAEIAVLTVSPTR